MTEEIEIPLGAFDSETIGWTYTIPEGFTAKIEDGKIIVEKAESEDEKIRKMLIELAKNCGELNFTNVTREATLAYLEKQKENKPVQDKEEREYVRTLKSLISDFLRGKEEVDREYYQKIYDWLDERHIEHNPAEWSEEDETAYGDLIWCIEQAKKSAKDENDMGNIWFAENWVKNHIKSLYPQPHWKPSEEQMEALRIAYEIGTANESWAMCVLKALYNDLKKL